MSSPSPLRPRGGTRQLRHPGATDGDDGADEGGPEAWNKMNLLALASMMADTGNGRPPAAAAAAAAAASSNRTNGGTKAAASAADDGTPAGSSPLHEAEVKVEAAASGEAPRQQQQAS